MLYAFRSSLFFGVLSSCRISNYLSIQYHHLLQKWDCVSWVRSFGEGASITNGYTLLVRAYITFWKGIYLVITVEDRPACRVSNSIPSKYSACSCTETFTAEWSSLQWKRADIREQCDGQTGGYSYALGQQRTNTWSFHATKASPEIVSKRSQTQGTNCILPLTARLRGLETLP